MNKKTCGKCSTDSKLYTLQKCGHIFCEKCLYEHVKSKFNQLESSKIKCPFRNCDKVLTDRDVRKFLSTNLIEQYDKLQFSQGAFQKCLTKNCPYIYISDGDLHFHCEYCDQPNCTKCKLRHYPNDCEKNENHEEIREKCAQEALCRRKRKEIKSFDLERDLVPNFDGFVCRICEEFFLPNTQVMLRTCQHEFCRKCLENSLKSKKSFDQLKCPAEFCDTSLMAVEISMLVGIDFADSLNKELIQPIVYRCKYPDCNGFWDYDSDKTGDYECPECRNMNCISCAVVHKKSETCWKYKSSNEYKNFKKEEEKVKSKSIVCNCGKILIHGGGCFALRCDNCFKQICLFTGKLAGKSLPEGCGCTSLKPCHDDCKYGCFPEKS